MEIVQNDSTLIQKKGIVSHWQLTPSLKFYAAKAKNEVAVITDNDYKTPGDYIYCLKDDLNKISNLQIYENQYDFPDTKTVLLVKKR